MKLSPGKFIRMKRADGEKVLAALRSCKYKQGFNYLYDKERGGFCCLGVMQKVISGKVETIGGAPLCLPTIEWLEKHGITFVNEEQQFAACVSPTIRVITKPYGEKHLTATEANDIYNMPFSEIADAWEAAMEVY